MKKIVITILSAICWLGISDTNASAQNGALEVGPVEKAAGGFRFTEGPVWHKDGYLLFTDIPANRINKFTPPGEVEVFREPSGQANGLTFNRDGQLLACEHGNRRVSITVNDASATLVDMYDGKKFNSPNDLVVRSDGMIFFTDPPYGLGNREKEILFNGVYRHNPATSETVALIRNFDRPNGIALSPDESTLYVADTTRNRVQAFDLDAAGDVSNSRLLGNVANPDGMKVDVDGRVYVTSHEGVVVFDPDGNRVTVIVVPEAPANCAFGGVDNKTLYITARSGLYKAELNVAGLPVWPVESSVE